MTHFEMAVDIGGTFTDLHLETDSGETTSYKVPTTSHDFTEGFFNALSKAAGSYDLSIQELLSNTQQLIHGTTIATNAIIEGNVPKTALLCTEGFHDTLWLREGGKSDPYDWDIDYPDPFIPRDLTYGIEERINAEGEVETELDREGVERIIAELDRRDVEAVAVSFLWAHVNSTHEQLVGELVEEYAPGMHYSLSHKINPIIREYRRTCSTAFDAALYGPINRYLSTLDERVREFGYDGNMLIISANGGVMEIDEIARSPIWTVDSGPTVLPVAANYHASHELNRENIIALDMGGTSLDMGVVRDGSIPRTREAKVGNDLLGIEKVEINSIGAGGGSIAWVDEGGLLHVGPESAGADPGPVCYGRGGERPTVTDAALVLGYLNDNWFLGGDMTIHVSAAEEALDHHVGAELELDTMEAAYSVYATANQNMVNGIKSVTIERGVDPRKYVLSGGGGALGTHVVQIARELQIDDVLLPGQAGVVCATGGLVSDIRRDFSSSLYTRSSQFDHEGVNDLLDNLREQGESFQDRAKIPEEDRTMRYYTEARYPSQVWELPVELDGAQLGSDAYETLSEQFHQVHEETYGFRMDQDVEFIYWRVEAIGETTDREPPTVETTHDSAEAARHNERKAYFNGETKTTPAYRADRLSPGDGMSGPAVVDADNTTIILPPRSELTVTGSGNYHIRT